MHDNGSNSVSRVLTLKTGLSGCGYAIVVVVISTLMLTINGVLCVSAYSAFTLFGPRGLTENPNVEPRVSQLFHFVTPVILLVLEWHLIDRLSRLFQRTEDECA